MYLKFEDDLQQQSCLNLKEPLVLVYVMSGIKSSYSFKLFEVTVIFTYLFAFHHDNLLKFSVVLTCVIELFSTILIS